MAPGPLSINGVDVSTLGYRLARAPGWLDAPPRQTPSAPRVLRAGAVRTAASTEGTRRLTLDGVVDAATADLARSQLDNLIRTILRTQPAQIILPDSATRFVSGYLDNQVT